MSDILSQWWKLTQMCWDFMNQKFSSFIHHLQQLWQTIRDEQPGSIYLGSWFQRFRFSVICTVDLGPVAKQNITVGACGSTMPLSSQGPGSQDRKKKRSGSQHSFQGHTSHVLTSFYQPPPLKESTTPQALSFNTGLLRGAPNSNCSNISVTLGM